MKNIKPVIGLLTRLAIVLITTTTFFLGYNRFLVDYSLNDLKLALDNIKKNELEGVDKILSYALAEELTKPQPEIYTSIALEYSKDVVSQPKKDRALEDVELIMEDIVKQKSEKRGRFVNLLDNASNTVARTFNVAPDLKERISEREKAEVEEAKLVEIKEKYPILKKYHEAVKNRKLARFEEAAEIYLAIASEYADSSIAPLLRFQAGATYRYDLNDEERASQVFETTKKDYPTSRLSLAPEERDLPPWMRAYPWRLVKQGINTIAVSFAKIAAQYATKGMQAGIGTTFSIRVSEEQISRVTGRHMDEFLKGTPFKVRNVRIRFLTGNRIEIAGDAQIGNQLTLKVYVLGRISVRSGRVVYDVEKVKVGPFNVPSYVMDDMLVESYRVFNQDLPFHLKRVSIDETKQISIWNGTKK